ncbi:MAG: hypothetical protein CH6_1083 [Candidatus Kapaibacterium sp.]|nr:MAG: hypothetical protein CH6_1083 [Candidatus Kapabacteria bacterium]
MKLVYDHGEISLSQGLEPTYKELKHRISDDDSILLLRLEPTYKELKQNSLEKALKEGMRLEPTYKELKLQKFLELFKII